MLSVFTTIKYHFEKKMKRLQVIDTENCPSDTEFGPLLLERLSLPSPEA